MRKIRRSLAATLKEFMRPPPAQNPCGSFHRPTTPRHSAISPTNSSVACCTSSPIRPPHRDRTNVAPSGRISIAHFCLSHKSSRSPERAWVQEGRPLASLRELHVPVLVRPLPPKRRSAARILLHRSSQRSK